MLKKIFVLSLLFLLVACNANKQEVIEIKDYIDPAKDVFLFDEIDENLKEIIKKANGNKDYNNYQFKMLNKEVYKDNLKDIDGNDFCFINDSISSYVLEIVSVDCSHCKDMVKSHIQYMNDSNIKTIQYFNVGDKQDILDFYLELDIDIPNNITIIPHDDGMNDYIKNELKAESYPSLIAYYNNKVSFMEYGDINEEELEAFYQLGFNNTLLIDNSLKDINGNDLLSLDRSIEDVEESLSDENINKLESLDNNNKTKDMTLKIIGTKCNYDEISNDKSSIYINEIGDYSVYKNKDVVLLYTYFRSTDDTDRIDFINSLIESNSEVEYIVVLIEGLEPTSSIYKSMNKKFKAKVTSVLGYTPEDFFKFGISDYPTALFIEKGTFTGAYSNIDGIDNFNKAIDMFIGDNSIALKTNN